MKNFFLMLCLTCSFYIGHAQKTSSIAITLKNITDINVEQLSFFEQPRSYNLERPSDDELRILLKRGYNLPRSAFFNVSKIDDHHYLLKYRSDKPEMVYLNYRPIYITPGDSVQLTYKMMGPNWNSDQDSLIAHGKNSSNYMFSNYLFNRALLKHKPEAKNVKYDQNVKLFYDDLVKFNQIKDDFFQPLFTKKACAKPLIDYLSRKRRIDFLFDLYYYEQEFQDNKHPQLAKFGSLIDSAFANTKFNPADTSLSFVMENVFRGYFKRLVNVKFNHLTSRKDYDHLYSDIKNYPNPFIREYFLYFFAMNYYKDPQNANAAEVDALVEQSKNANIRKAFKDRI